MTWFKPVEEIVIKREQNRNFRSRLTIFERDVLEAEKKALKYPYSTYRQTQKSKYMDSNGYWRVCEIEVIKHDDKWIIEFIQKELGSKGLIMGAKQIRDIITNQIYHVFKAADTLFDAPPMIQLPLPLNITPNVTKAA